MKRHLSQRIISIIEKGGEAPVNFEGSVFRILGRYEEALGCYDKAPEIDPEFEKARNNKKEIEKILKIRRKIQKDIEQKR